MVTIPFATNEKEKRLPLFGSLHLDLFNLKQDSSLFVQ
jgi:hypothetical protein